MANSNPGILTSLSLASSLSPAPFVELFCRWLVVSEGLCSSDIAELRYHQLIKFETVKYIDNLGYYVNGK